MESLIVQFLNLLYSQIDRGIYVWGGNGENLSEMQRPIDFIMRHEANAQDEKRDIALYRQRVSDGMTDIRAFDCSGLVYWALKELGLQKSDVSSRGLYALCDKIKSADLRPGDLVFHAEKDRIVHVGVYAGVGKYIEAKGRDVGVVCGTRRSGYWTHFGRWKAFEDEPETPKFVLVKGGSVRVREGDGTYARCIGIAHRGEKYPYLGDAPSGWYMIRYHSVDAYISNLPKLTEVIS